MPVLDLSAYKPVPATLGDANQVANGMQAIQNCINALDNNNFAAGKIFDPLKLMQNGAIPGQGLVWSAAANGGTGGWVPGGVNGLYRKVTSKQVVNSVVETDLLNGEIALPASILGTTGVLRLTARGDYLQNTGAAADVPRFKLKLGATTLIDLGPIGFPVIGNLASRVPWWMDVVISNLGAANSQLATMRGRFVHSPGSALGGNGPATGVGNVGTVTVNGTTANRTDYDAENTSAVDTTAGLALVLSVILPVANALYDVTLKSALVEIV